MRSGMRRIEVAFVAFMLLAGAAFLLKMCYLSLAFNTAFASLFLVATHTYIRLSHRIIIPPALLLLVFLAVQVDALGNYFRLYGRDFGPMQYDQFAHLTVQALVTPLIVWLVQRFMHKFSYPLPLSIATLFSTALMFSIASIYEIIELWDELHFGGQRIWGKYDTALDLQWDLCGIVLGSLVARVLLTHKHPANPEMLAVQRHRTGQPA